MDLQMYGISYFPKFIFDITCIAVALALALALLNGSNTYPMRTGV
jgi:hypothetical protein